MAEIQLSAGTIRYTDTGDGPPIVFVHGALTNGMLWRKVVAALGDGVRCIVPDWPLGSHSVAMHPDADLSPSGLASLVEEFLDALELSDVTLVGNDTGGAICQLVAAGRPERVGRLVLTPCDAFDNFPPRLFRYLVWAARVPGALPALLQVLRVRVLHRLPIAFGWLAKRAIDREASVAYVRPYLTDPGVRRDLRKLLLAASPRYTMGAAKALGAFDRPVLIAWAREDKVFPPAHAIRLAALFEDARLEWIEDSYSFVSEDSPQRTAQLIGGFVTQRREAAC